MRILTRLTLPLAAIGSTLLLLPGDAAAADPAGTTVYMTQLRGMFAAWDRDNDKHLDREELARAFRGAKAKPYMPPPKEKGSKEPDLSRYPDALFLAQLDENGDDKISFKEFEAWAKEYARQMRDIAEAQEQMIELQKKMLKASKRDLEKMESQMRDQRKAMEKLADQMKAYEKYLQQQFKPKK